MSELSAKTLDPSHKSRRLTNLENEDGRENFWRELGDVKIPLVVPQEKNWCQYCPCSSNLVSGASKSLIKSLLVIL